MDFSSVVATHLNGFFLCVLQAIPRMVERGKGGSIVSIASTAAFVGLPGRGAYCAAKAGILGLTRAMATEVANERHNASTLWRPASPAPSLSTRRLPTARCRKTGSSETCRCAASPRRRRSPMLVRFLAGDELSGT